MIEKIREVIQNSDKILITSHVNPDGDSIGSEIAFYNYLQKIGKKDVTIINCSPTPDNYTFLDNEKIIKEYSESLHKDLIQNSNVSIVLDTNEYDRLKEIGPLIKNSAAIKICIDHHMDFDENNFNYYIIDTESPATGEILYNYFSSSDGFEIDKSIAVPLYTAIMTDTGSFRYPRTDSETHLIAADLIEKGADPVRIHNLVYDTSSVGVIRLLTRFLNKLTFLYDNELVYAVITKDDFTETGTGIMDTDGFSKHMLSINSVKLAIIFTESARGVKISFRSKNELPANKLANEFGGGGHLNAAGAFVENPDTEQLISTVLTKSKFYFQ